MKKKIEIHDNQHVRKTSPVQHGELNPKTNFQYHNKLQS